MSAVIWNGKAVTLSMSRNAASYCSAVQMFKKTVLRDLTTSVNWCDVIDIQFDSDFDFLHKPQPRMETDKLGSVRTACPVNDRYVAE